MHYGTGGEDHGRSETHVWLDAYRDSNEIEGWVDNGIFSLLHLITEVLDTRHVPGGALEIGVHHGKFFIALNAIVDAQYNSVALDLFDNQEFNIDFSGRGSYGHFTENLKKFDRHKGGNVIIESRDSTSVDPISLLALSKSPFKVVSVDGGHTAEHTISDILLADNVIQPQGFVLVDDILNSHWMGVIDGVTNYLKTRPRLWPLAVGYNKLVMCRMSMQPAYKLFFQQRFAFTKSTNLCGYEVLAV
jgi:hypothetical protein